VGSGIKRLPALQRVIEPLVYPTIAASLLGNRGEGIPDAQSNPRTIGRLAIRNVEDRKIRRLIAAPYRLPARDIAVLEFGLWHRNKRTYVTGRRWKEVAAKRHDAVIFRQPQVKIT
jgi:hypothetical protein